MFTHQRSQLVSFEELYWTELPSLSATVCVSQLRPHRTIYPAIRYRIITLFLDTRPTCTTDPLLARSNQLWGPNLLITQMAASYNVAQSDRLGQLRGHNKCQSHGRLRVSIYSSNETDGHICGPLPYIVYIRASIYSTLTCEPGIIYTCVDVVGSEDWSR